MLAIFEKLDYNVIYIFNSVLLFFKQNVNQKFSSRHFISVNEFQRKAWKYMLLLPQPS